jgi:hypothetical protein
MGVTTRPSSASASATHSSSPSSTGAARSSSRSTPAARPSTASTGATASWRAAPCAAPSPGILSIRLASQLSLSIDADLESVLARANNQAVLADIDREAAVLAQHHARARSRIEQQRQRELRVSTVQRDAEIAAGRAARRARVKAAADAFAAEARGQPGASAIASHTTVPDPSGAARPRDCADPPCRPPLPAPSSVTCISDGDNTVAHATDPATARTSDPASTPPSVANTSPSTPPDRPPSRPPNRPLNRPSNRPPDCIDQRDCPSGMSCDLDTGVCCATIVR